MCNSQLTERWRRHRNVLKNALERQEKQARQTTYPASVKNKALLADLAASLRDFSVSHMQFFADGFSDKWLDPDEEHPEEFILGVTSRQIAHDLSVIERAIDQRRDGVEKRKILEQADVIARDALSSAESFLNGQVSPVTYLNKSPVIRVIPYAPVALIGIPYTAMDAIDDRAKRQSDTFDYLAIAHEVGHYIYWHGCYGDPKEHFYDQLYGVLEGQFPPADAEYKPLYAHWLEEIFADVYAAMVGGTATALSIQEVVSDNLPKRMTKDDGEHPLAVLRPFIYTQVLRQMGLEDAARNLEQLWLGSHAYAQALRASPDTVQICRYDQNGESIDKEVRSLNQVKADLQTIAVLISNALQINTDSTKQVWTKEADPEQIFTAFNDKVQHVFPRSQFNGIVWPNYEERNNQAIGEWHLAGQAISLDILNHLVNAQAEIRHQFAKNSATKIPFSSDEPGNPTWKPIYQVGGWSSGGGDDAYPN